MPFQVSRWEVSQELSAFVAHIWQVRWSLSAGVEHTQPTLPDPVVHVAFEGGQAHIHGPLSHRFQRRLEGSGQVLGVRFRAAAFRAVWEQPLWTLRDRILPLQTPEIREPEEALRWLEDFVPTALDPALARLRDHVETLLSADEVTRVPTAAQALGVSERTLQRRHKDAVGWTPLEVLRRRRVKALLAALDAGERELAELAYRLGYADQAHLSRDFKGLIGRTPTQYIQDAQARR